MPRATNNKKSSDTTTRVEYRRLQENDVIMGRGNATNYFSGNRQFRQLVDLHRNIYVNTKRDEKRHIAKTIVQTIQNKGGYFVQRTSSKDGVPSIGQSCIIVPEPRAVEKTAQALREKDLTKNRLCRIKKTSRAAAAKKQIKKNKNHGASRTVEQDKDEETPSASRAARSTVKQDGATKTSSQNAKSSRKKRAKRIAGRSAKQEPDQDEGEEMTPSPPPSRSRHRDVSSTSGPRVPCGMRSKKRKVGRSTRRTIKQEDVTTQTSCPSESTMLRDSPTGASTESEQDSDPEAHSSKPIRKLPTRACKIPKATEAPIIPKPTPRGKVILCKVTLDDPTGDDHGAMPAKKLEAIIRRPTRNLQSTVHPTRRHPAAKTLEFAIATGQRPSHQERATPSGTPSSSPTSDTEKWSDNDDEDSSWSSPEEKRRRGRAIHPILNFRKIDEEETASSLVMLKQSTPSCHSAYSSSAIETPSPQLCCFPQVRQGLINTPVRVAADTTTPLRPALLAEYTRMNHTSPTESELCFQQLQESAPSIGLAWKTTPPSADRFWRPKPVDYALGASPVGRHPGEFLGLLASGPHTPLFVGRDISARTSNECPRGQPPLELQKLAAEESSPNGPALATKVSNEYPQVEHSELLKLTVHPSPVQMQTNSLCSKKTPPKTAAIGHSTKRSPPPIMAGRSRKPSPLIQKADVSQLLSKSILGRSTPSTPAKTSLGALLEQSMMKTPQEKPNASQRGQQQLIVTPAGAAIKTPKGRRQYSLPTRSSKKQEGSLVTAALARQSSPCPPGKSTPLLLLGQGNMKTPRQAATSRSRLRQERQLVTPAGPSAPPTIHRNVETPRSALNAAGGDQQQRRPSEVTPAATGTGRSNKASCSSASTTVASDVSSKWQHQARSSTSTTKNHHNTTTTSDSESEDDSFDVSCISCHARGENGGRCTCSHRHQESSSADDDAMMKFLPCSWVGKDVEVNDPAAATSPVTVSGTCSSSSPTRVIPPRRISDVDDHYMETGVSSNLSCGGSKSHPGPSTAATSPSAAVVRDPWDNFVSGRLDLML